MTKSKKSSSLMSYAGTFGALVILCVVLAIASPNFFKYSNMMSVLKQTSFNALVSTGMLLCLITAGIDLTAGRFVVYGAVSVAVLAVSWRRARRPTLAQAWGALWLSVLGFTGYYWVLVLSIRDAGTEMPALIVGTIPIWVMLLGKPHGLRWAAMLPGLALTAAGLVLMSNAALSGAEQAPAASESIATSSTYWRGIALSVLAMVCWTVFTLLNARWLRQHPEVGSTDWANWLGVATGLGGLLLALTLGTPLPQLMASPGWPLFALIAIAIGLLAGVLPARRAARLDPVEALRAE